jgi:TrmH family RNA methyltransferase
VTITSAQNEKLKTIRKLQGGRRDGRFVAEGEDLLAAADAAGWPAEDRLVAAGSGLDGTEVEPELLARVSALGSGTRAIGVFRERWAPPAGPVCVALFGVRDPGNVGTVLRSAAAFGAGSVAVAPGTADPFGAKAVRASMGAVFALPIARVEDVDALPGETIALVARPDAEPLRGPLAPCTLLVGAERAGLPDGVVARADRVARVPIHTESLNAAMAATVALYEVTRSP